MPTRRTSPRRTATRPSGLYERPPGPLRDDEIDEPGAGFLADAAPWLAVLAVVLAAAALAFVVFGRSGGDLTACRTAAWGAIPKDTSLPDGWGLGSTDLNANGMTISIVGPAQPDDTTNQPVVYASVTCYGDAAATALEQNRAAAEKAGANVSDRTLDGSAYDVDNPSSGSRTTLFRVGGLVGQVADGGTASAADLATITTAVATAMGDKAAAGAPAPEPTDDPGASLEPLGSDDVGAIDPSASPFAPDLEALLPRSITLGSTSASPGPLALTVVSGSASDAFGDNPNSRAFAARIRSLGSTFDELQVAQVFDESGTVDLLINAFRLPKSDVAKLRAAVFETWLSADAEGVKTTTITLGGKSMTKVDYGDGQTIEYLYVVDDAVIVIDTSDVDVATQVATQLK